MYAKIFTAVAANVLCVFVHVAMGQGQLGPCSQGLEGELPNQCMLSNGIDYNGTLFIISGNRTGSLPAGTTYQVFKDLLCSDGKKDQVVPCMLQLAQKWNKTGCTAQDRQLMTQRAAQFLALIDGYCRDACENDATQRLIQCFAAIQVDPTPILNQNATIIVDKFTFVGNDSASATKFCNSRQRLFTCLSPLASECPQLTKTLHAFGIDLAGLERATKVQCENLDTYLQTYQCLTSQSPALQECNQAGQQLLEQVQKERFLTGVTVPSKYQGRLCQTKLSKVDCELRKFESVCDTKSKELLSTFECTSMPQPCQTGSDTLAIYEALCKKAATPAPTVPPRPTPPPDTSNPTGGNSGNGGGGKGQPDSGAAVVVPCYAVLASVLMALMALLV